MMLPRSHRLALLVVATVLWLPRGAAAQTTSRSTIVVQAADVETGQPLVGAQVRIPQLGRVATAKAMGEATIRLLPGGIYHVEGRMLGYQPMDVDVVLSGTDSLEVLMLMRRQAQLLPGVKIVGRMSPARLAEFERRRNQSIGHFLDAEQLAQLEGREIALVLASRFPGLRLIADDDNPAFLAVASTRTSGLFGNAPCKPNVYLDDFPLRDDLGSVRVEWLAGIEWYPGETAPIQYRRPGFACGTLLLWSAN